MLEIRKNFSAQYSHKEQPAPARWYNSDSGKQYENFKKRDNWWYDANADIMYNINGNIATVQYGLNRSDFASARGFWEEIAVNNEVQNPDGSITADVTLTLSSIMGYKTSMSQAGYNAITTIKLAGQQVAQRNGKTIDSFNIYPKPATVTKRVTVYPQQVSDELNIEYNTVYPNGEYPNNSIWLGMTVYNPTPPQYIPMAQRKGGNWNSLNDHNGNILIRKSGKWVDRSKENSNTSKNENTGHNRIRKNGKWLQLPKM